jgi:hypothetical protein
MTDKVVQLNVVPVRGAPNPGVVARLEECLAAARRGDLTSVFVAGLQTDGSILSGFQMHDGDSVFCMLGCIESAKRDFMNLTIEQR